MWDAKVGARYYLLVKSHDYTITDGNFLLTVQTFPTTPLCDHKDVVDIGTIPDEGVKFDGSTISELLFSLPTLCQISDGHLSSAIRGIAFTFTGDGTAHVLSVGNVYGFRPKVTIFKGSCDSLECLPTDSHTDSFLVGTEPGETYIILIGDCCSLAIVDGTFTLHAKRVVAGNITADLMGKIDSFDSKMKMVMGTTSSGTFYPNLPLCQFSVDSPAAIYQLDTGAGFFSAHVSGFGFDAHLSVVKANELGAFECYGTPNDRQISWEGEEGLYLVVYGCCDMNAVGDFSLRLNKPPISNEPCNDVYDLGSVSNDGLTHVGTFAGWQFLANSQDVTNCYYAGHVALSGGRSKVFRVIGNGKALVASTFVPESTLGQGIQVSLTVMKGSCDTMECIKGAYLTVDPSWSVTWPSVAGETYDIVISTCCAETEDEFILMVYEDGTKLFGSNRTAVTGLGNNTMNDTNHGVDADSSSSKLRKGMSFWLDAVVLLAIFSFN